MADCYDGDEWSMDFRRALSVQDYNRWLELSHDLSGVSLNSSPDRVIWVVIL